MLKKAALVILLGIITIPFCYLITLSMATEWRFPALLPSALTLAHWTEISSVGGNWIASALTSLCLAFSVGIMGTASGFLTAQQLSRHEKRAFWLSLSYLPYAFSPVIYAHSIKFFFNVAGLSGSFAGVFLAHFILVYPFATLLFFRHFDQNLRAMEDLTYTLGGTRWTSLTKVLIPVSKGPLLICFFQTFLISWFEYGLISVIGQGQVRTLTIGVFQYIGEANQYLAALASCLICIPPLLLLWMNHRFVFREKMI